MPAEIDPTLGRAWFCQGHWRGCPRAYRTQTHFWSPGCPRRPQSQAVAAGAAWRLGNFARCLCCIALHGLRELLHDSVRSQSNSGSESGSDYDSDSDSVRVGPAGHGFMAAALAPMSGDEVEEYYHGSDSFDALTIDEVRRHLYQEAARGLEPVSWGSFQDPGATSLLAEPIEELVRDQ